MNRFKRRQLQHQNARIQKGVTKWNQARPKPKFSEPPKGTKGRIPKAKATKKKGYMGAYVINPTRRGLIPEPIVTEDYSALYPSICFSRGLGYRTLLTSKTIKKYGLQMWQYAKHVLGPASLINCGEEVYDPVAQKQHGYHTPYLKVAYFYSEDPRNTPFGKMIEKLNSFRNAAKKSMSAAAESLDNIKHHLSEGHPLTPGSRQAKMVMEDGMPIVVVRRMFKIEHNIHDSNQLAFKICNNSSYGFTGTNADKAMIPCMEIAATITATGRFEIIMARSIATRTTGAYAKAYAVAERSVWDHESYEDPKDVTKRISRKTGETYATWAVSPSYVQKHEVGGAGRVPLVDCSCVAKLSEEFLHATRHYRMSPSKIDVIYGDTDSIMIELCPILFDTGHLQGIRDCANGGRYIAYMINRFEYEVMKIVWEKMAIGMQMNQKKYYKMRIVSEVTGKTKEILERGASVRRDCLPFVKNIIDKHKHSVLESIGGGKDMQKVLNDIAEDIRTTMRDVYEGNYALDDFVLSKGLTKLAYIKKPEHVVVAENNKKYRGVPITPGTSVYYLFKSLPFSEGDFGKFDAYMKRHRANDDTFDRLTGGQYTANYWAPSNNAGDNKKQERGGEEEEEENEVKIHAATTPRVQNHAMALFNRGHKGLDLAEDAQYMKDSGLTMDLHYMFKHRIEKPLLAYFAPMFYPRDDMPYIDNEHMTPAEVIKTESIQKRIKKEQQKAAHRLLFSEFDNLMTSRNLAICSNAKIDFDKERAKKRKREAEEVTTTTPQPGSIMQSFKRQRTDDETALSTPADHGITFITMENLFKRRAEEPPKAAPPPPKKKQKTTVSKTLPLRGRGKKSQPVVVPPTNTGRKITNFFASKAPLKTEPQIESPPKIQDEEKEEEKKVASPKKTLTHGQGKKIYCECIWCYKIQKVVVTADTRLLLKSQQSEVDDPVIKNWIDITTLPGIICTKCSRNTHAIVQRITSEITRRQNEQRMQAIKCKGCTYLLDSPHLDPDNCKSAHCVVFKQKRATNSALKYKINQLNLFQNDISVKPNSDTTNF